MGPRWYLQMISNWFVLSYTCAVEILIERRHLTRNDLCKNVFVQSEYLSDRACLRYARDEIHPWIWRWGSLNNDSNHARFLTQNNWQKKISLSSGFGAVIRFLRPELHISRRQPDAKELLELLLLLQKMSSRTSQRRLKIIDSCCCWRGPSRCCCRAVLFLPVDPQPLIFFWKIFGNPSYFMFLYLDKIFCKRYLSWILS